MLLHGKAKAKLKKDALSEKTTNAIALFIASNMMLKYIPAVRTSAMAERVINDMLRQRLSLLEDNAEFIGHAKSIERWPRMRSQRLDKRRQHILKRKCFAVNMRLGE